ncbi:unnamed protein product [Lasius platythorax]|uniref:Uncharacterized protein n=1 Tax=Lasius platythorax TaxID=488582 RepID=A0AAV2N3A9_9HYME
MQSTDLHTYCNIRTIRAKSRENPREEQHDV